MKLKIFYFIIPILFTSCGSSICDCINAERNEDGSFKNYELEQNCNELLEIENEKLLQLSPEEREQALKEFEEKVNSCH